MNRAAIILVFFSLLVVGGSWWSWINSVAEMRAENATAQEQLAATVRDCNAALEAAQAALQAREVINVQTRERMARLEQVLRDADSICIPDSLREFYANGCAAAAGGTPDAN